MLCVSLLKPARCRWRAPRCISAIKFQLVAAMNPCRCGYAEDPDLACHRLPICRQEYIGRLSGPLLDRFDVRVNVPPVPLAEMMGSAKGEASAISAARVGAAREVQMARQNCLNAHLDGEALKLAAPDLLLDNCDTRAGLTAWRVARTLASRIVICRVWRWRDIVFRMLA